MRISSDHDEWKANCDEIMAIPGIDEALPLNQSQRTLGLKLMTVQLAKLAVKLSSQGEIEDESLTSLESQNIFARMQIYCNHILQQNGKPTFPLYHLTPTMLLSDPEEENGSGTISEAKMISTKKKKKKRKDKELNMNCNMISSDDGFMTGMFEDESIMVSLPRSTRSRLIEASTSKRNNAPDMIRLIVNEYEKEIQLLKEQQEEVIRSLHMRLFITETSLQQEIEKNEELLKFQRI